MSFDSIYIRTTQLCTKLPTHAQMNSSWFQTTQNGSKLELLSSRHNTQPRSLGPAVAISVNKPTLGSREMNHLPVITAVDFALSEPRRPPGVNLQLVTPVRCAQIHRKGMLQRLFCAPHSNVTRPEPVLSGLKPALDGNVQTLSDNEQCWGEGGKGCLC